MIKTAVICFTERGAELANRIKGAESAGGIKPEYKTEVMAEGFRCEYSFELYAKYEGFDSNKYTRIKPVTESLNAWTLSMQKNKYALIFISAMGIAVRAIAGGLESKLSDSPVVVVDELGLHAIPVVSGHVGGANELAIFISNSIGAVPVITTATDIEEAFSVDLFAKENGLRIHNKDGIKKVSAKALEGKPIRLCIENYPPKKADIIVSGDEKYKAMKDECDILLCPKKYAVGIGCRRGTEFEDLKAFFEKVLTINGIKPDEVGAIASIDLKADEEGIIELGRFYRIPFITYTSELLEKAAGDFTESDFVKEKTGVGNVCERAAVLLTGNRGVILQDKYSENGMTLAIAMMDGENV